MDDSVWPEENDIRRRFLSDEGAAFTLLLKIYEHAGEPLALVVYCWFSHDVTKVAFDWEIRI